MQKRKATIIGAGHVGSHVALALVYEGVADEIVLVDKVEGAAAYLDDFRQVRIILVIGFTDLEIYVAVLYSITQCRVLRIQSSVLMGLDVLLIHQGDDFVHVRKDAQQALMN